MKVLKIGDITTLTSPENGAPLYYVAIDPVMKYKNLPCVFLATDPANKNTYSRYTIEYLNEHGYNITLKIKYTTTIYNRNNPDGKTVTKMSTGAPVAPLDFIKTASDTINLKNDKWRYLIEPENIIKIYGV